MQTPHLFAYKGVLKNRTLNFSRKFWTMFYSQNSCVPNSVLNPFYKSKKLEKRFKIKSAPWKMMDFLYVFKNHLVIDSKKHFLKSCFSIQTGLTFSESFVLFIYLSIFCPLDQLNSMKKTNNETTQKKTLDKKQEGSTHELFFLFAQSSKNSTRKFEPVEKFEKLFKLKQIFKKNILKQWIHPFLVEQNSLKNRFFDRHQQPHIFLEDWVNSLTHSIKKEPKWGLKLHFQPKDFFLNSFGIEIKSPSFSYLKTNPKFEHAFQNWNQDSYFLTSPKKCFLFFSTVEPFRFVHSNQISMFFAFFQRNWICEESALKSLISTRSIMELYQRSFYFPNLLSFFDRISNPLRIHEKTEIGFFFRENVKGLEHVVPYFHLFLKLYKIRIMKLNSFFFKKNLESMFFTLPFDGFGKTFICSNEIRKQNQEPFYIWNQSPGLIHLVDQGEILCQFFKKKIFLSLDKLHLYESFRNDFFTSFSANQTFKCHFLFLDETFFYFSPQSSQIHQFLKILQFLCTKYGFLFSKASFFHSCFALLNEPPGFEFRGFYFAQQVQRKKVHLFSKKKWHSNEIRANLPYNFSPQILPSPQSFLLYLDQLKKIIQYSKVESQSVFIQRLRIHIEKWCFYYKGVSNKKSFYFCDHLLFQWIWKWSCRRHPNKNRRWIQKKYYHFFPKVPNQTSWSHHSIQMNRMMRKSNGWHFCFYNKSTETFECLPQHSDRKLIQYEKFPTQASIYNERWKFFFFRSFPS